MDTSPSRDRLFPLPTKAYGSGEWEVKGRSAFLELAEGLGLGVAARDKIKISEVNLGCSRPQSASECWNLDGVWYAFVRQKAIAKL